MNPPPDPVVEDLGREVKRAIVTMLPERKPFHDSNKREREEAWNILERRLRREIGI